jgi:hypothetical protein
MMRIIAKDAAEVRRLGLVIYGNASRIIALNMFDRRSDLD